MLEERGYSLEPISSELDVDKRDGEYASLGGSYKCFSTFFPGVEKVNHETLNKKIQESEKESVWRTVEPKNGDYISDAEGCSMMQLSYNYIKNKASYNFVFKSEITVKNDKVGLALWVTGEYIKNSEGVSASIKYFLFFLEKEYCFWNHCHCNLLGCFLPQDLQTVDPFLWFFMCCTQPA